MKGQDFRVFYRNSEVEHLTRIHLEALSRKTPINSGYLSNLESLRSQYDKFHYCPVFLRVAENSLEYREDTE